MSAGIRNMTEQAGAEQVGGKAAALMRLAALGFDVPAFFVVEPPDIDRDALAGALQLLGDGPFAVRSSAREEDGSEHSHAGQFLSLLDVPAADVADAVIKVFASSAAESVETYRQSRGLGGGSDAPAAIVQKMVPARAAGVAFTADPVSGRRDRIVVSAVAGLGDRLVGGEEDGETHVLDKVSGAALETPDDPVLTADDLVALHALALDVEDKLGVPQDIEWAFAGDRLHLLQARPITTALRPAPNPDAALQVFDNSNIVESYPGLVSPLTFSFAQYAYARVYRAFVRLVGVREETIRENAAVFDNMLARIDGRVYYNLVNWYRALALLPGFAINRAHMETMMGVAEPLPEEAAAGIGPAPASGLGLLREWLRVGRVGLLLGFEALRLKGTVAGFERRLDAAITGKAEKLAGMSLTELAAEYRRIEADLLDRWDAPLVNDFLCMMGFGASRKLLEKWAGPAGLELHNHVMIGQGDIVSAEPARRIREMGALVAGDDDLRRRLTEGDRTAVSADPKLRVAFDAYIEKFADRCTEELKLESVTLDRDPKPLLMAVAAAAGSGNTKRRDEPAPPDIAMVLAGKPVRRAVARAVLGWAKRRVRDRENLRFERTRIFGLARRLFRVVGAHFHAHGLIDEPDDVFFLTVDQVLGTIEGYAVDRDLAGLVRLRRAEMEEAAAHPDPPERLVVRGAAIATRAAAAPVPVAARDDARERTGTGCSAGTVTARARVVRDPRTESLAPGDILVARHTDPGWIAVFSNAAAIVVERGSLLSHSAIVARELGIPCVVGLKGAMDWIADGETITVDGSTGLVRRAP